MKLEDMKRIAEARTPFQSWQDFYNDCTENNAKFAEMAANNIDLLLECAEFVKTVAPSWLPEGIRNKRLDLLRALEK